MARIGFCYGVFSSGVRVFAYGAVVGGAINEPVFWALVLPALVDIALIKFVVPLPMGPYVFERVGPGILVTSRRVAVARWAIVLTPTLAGIHFVLAAALDGDARVQVGLGGIVLVFMAASVVVTGAYGLGLHNMYDAVRERLADQPNSTSMAAGYFGDLRERPEEKSSKE